MYMLLLPLQAYMLSCAAASPYHTLTPCAAACLVLQVGWTPLHCAVQGGHLEVMGLLLGAGAAVDAFGNVSLTG
jgi:hypothetical protein